MLPAREAGVPVRVKNSYNSSAPGTLISPERDMEGELLTSIVLKQSVTMLDIASLRMLGHFGFLAKVAPLFTSCHNSSSLTRATLPHFSP